MKVTLKEKDFDYVSDYPDGWLFSSGDSFKFPVLIGHYKCFIKRFEKKKPGDMSGWELMNKLKGRFDSNLPGIYDIVATEEKSKKVYYIFFEYLNGASLDLHIAHTSDINLPRLTNDLFSALKSLHKYEYWFADFTEKNIFYEENGRYLLIDIDSSQSVSKPPHNDMYGDKEYWALVFTFFQEVLHHKELKPSDLNGLALNYLQMIFLILRLKISVKDEKYEYKSEELYNTLPLFLNSIDVEFKRIFEEALEKKAITDYLLWGNDIKNIIFSKIIENHFEYSTVTDYPVIKFFETNRQIAENGTAFTLSWEVENALEVEVHRNGVLYKKMGIDERNIEINEFYDGKKKKVLYNILVSNESGAIKSKPITITITDSVDTVTDTGKDPPDFDGRISNKDKIDEASKITAADDKESKKPRKIRIIAIASILAVIAALAVVFYSSAGRKKVNISILKSEVYEGNTLIIFGDNLPPDTNNVEVYFNREKGNIIKYSQSNIQVIVPEIKEPDTNGNVKVALVIKGDTTYAPGNLIVRESIKIDSTYTVPASEASTVAKNKDTATKPRPVQIVLKKGGKKTETKKDTKNEIKANTKGAVVTPGRNKRFNIYDHLSSVSLPGSNRVTVRNKSKYDLDLINVSVSYLNNKGEELSKEIISFKNVRAHSSATVSVRNPNNRERVDPKIISVSSKQLDKDLQ